MLLLPRPELDSATSFKLGVTSDTDFSALQGLISQGRLNDALESLRQLPAEVQGSDYGLYLIAVCQRHSGDLTSAEISLLSLISQASSYGRAFQELGHLYRSTGRLQEALGAYATACHLNPALRASWTGQQLILREFAQSERLAQVDEKLNWLQSLPPILIAAIDQLYENKLVKAEELCRRFLQKFPKHIDAILLLAQIAVRHGVLEEAEFLLESAVAFEPSHKQARIEYIQVLSKRQRYAHAVEEAQDLYLNEPYNPQLQSLYAIQCMQLGDFQTALEMFDRILIKVPNDPVTHVSRGHALKTGGRTQEAILSYKKACEVQPMHCESWYALANLKTYNFSLHEIKKMEEIEKNPHLAGQDRVYLQFALGKAFEDMKKYEQSFIHYQKGNAAKKTQIQYRAEGTSGECEEQIRACNPNLFNVDRGCMAPDPIFIVGLPRAGSTLLEQILSSHSMVDGTLELPNVLSLSGRLRRQGKKSGTDYPFNLESLSPEELSSLGEEYIRDTRIHRKSAPFFIDKMPNNFRHIGLIKLMLPKAKIIDARREAMACCFSGYKQLFAEGQLFSYDLRDIARYYNDYVRLMDHWDKVIPGYVLRVQHEEVVEDLSGQVHRILDFCGLPFEDSCLEFYKTERNVRTPSSEQVRQPIYNSAVDHWKNYELWLEPVREILSQGESV
jgi:tetratricopeptide (TPR) repeat protein